VRTRQQADIFRQIAPKERTMLKEFIHIIKHVQVFIFKKFRKELVCYITDIQQLLLV
jgi:hypothetical protein